MKKEVIKEEKVKKCCNCLIYLLAVLLAVSIFLNGWLLHERTAQAAPENHPLFEGGYPCKTHEDCPSGTCACDACTSAKEEDCKSRKREFGDGGWSGCCASGALHF